MYPVKILGGHVPPHAPPRTAYDATNKNMLKTFMERLKIQMERHSKYHAI